MLFGLSEFPAYTPRYNIAPSAQVLIVSCFATHQPQKMRLHARQLRGHLAHAIEWDRAHSGRLKRNGGAAMSPLSQPVEADYLARQVETTHCSSPSAVRQ